MYLEQDSKLDRKVALKLLLSEFVSNEARRCFGYQIPESQNRRAWHRALEVTLPKLQHRTVKMNGRGSVADVMFAHRIDHHVEQLARVD